MIFYCGKYRKDSIKAKRKNRPIAEENPLQILKGCRRKATG